MNIRGNITFKDNMKLVYINLILVVLCVFLLFRYYTEKSYKPIVAIDSGHAVYSGRLIQVKDSEAVAAQLKAHIRLSYMYLFNLTEYNYHEHIEKGLHLWSYTGGEIVTDFEREGIYDFLSSTPSRLECQIQTIEFLGEKEVKNLKYPQVFVNEETGTFGFRDQVKNGVKTYEFKVITYRRIVRGRQLVAEEIHTEEIEVYSGFDIDQEYNPFGYKTETIKREVERITE